jgi:chromosome segregation ATPase
MTYWWHVHHDVLFEEIIGSVEERIAYIKAEKPKDEVEVRLRLLKPVRYDTAKLKEAYAKLKEAYAKREEADAKWKEAYAKWEEAYAKREEADAKLEEAYAKWEEVDAKRKEVDAKRKEAYAKWEEAVASSHKDQCPDCPWNGHTIFPQHLPAR